MYKRILISAYLTASLVCAEAQTKRVAVIPSSFADIRLELSQEEIRGRIDSVEHYFNSQIGEKRLELVLCDRVVLSKNRAHYGADGSEGLDEMIFKAVMEACMESDSKVDFSRLDGNGDGEADCIMLLCAGGSQDEGDTEDAIWPQYSSLDQFKSSLTLDGKMINTFCTITEKDSFGTLCHESGHIIGLPDFYDTDGNLSGGQSNGIGGCNSLMDRGRHNNNGHTPPSLNAIELDLASSARVRPLTLGSQVLRPLSSGGSCLRYDNGDEGEAYYIECRDKQLWDKYLDGKGLLIYHIRRDGSDAGWSDYYSRKLSAAERWQLNQINCNPEYLCASIVQTADGSKYFPSNGKDRFGFDSEERFNFGRTEHSTLAFVNIRTLPDGSVSFDAIEPLSAEIKEIFQDGAIIQWTLDDRAGNVEDYTIFISDNDGNGIFRNTRDNTMVIDGLKAGTDYNITIGARFDDRNHIYLSLALRTKAKVQGVPAYINLSGDGRLADGSFRKGSRILLHVSNIEEGASVEWSFDGREIQADADGRYTVTAGGKLRATIRMSDGTTEIIQRIIKVK